MALQLAGKPIWQQEPIAREDPEEGALVEVVSVQQGRIVRPQTPIIDRLFPRVNRLRNAHPVKLHCPLGGHSVGNQWNHGLCHSSGSVEPFRAPDSGPTDDDSEMTLMTEEDQPTDAETGETGACDGPLCQQIRGKYKGSFGCAPPQTILISYIGAGLMPGDTMNLRLVAGPYSTVELTSSGATLIFGKHRPSKTITIWGKDGVTTELDNRKPSTLSANRSNYSIYPGALVIIACQPMIPCIHSNFLQQTTINLMYQKLSSASTPAEHCGGSVVLIEWLSSGRKARGENWAFDKVETNTRIYVTYGDRDTEKVSQSERARGAAFVPAKSYTSLNREEHDTFVNRTDKIPETNCIYRDCQRIVGNPHGGNVELPAGIGHSGVGVTGTLVMIGPRVQKLMNHVEKKVKDINANLQQEARTYSIRDPSHMHVKGCDASGSAFLAELDLPDFLISTSRFESNLVWRGSKLGGMTVKLMASTVEQGMEKCQQLMAPLFTSLGSRITSKSSQLTASQGSNWTKQMYGRSAAPKCQEFGNSNAYR